MNFDNFRIDCLVQALKVHTDIEAAMEWCLQNPNVEPKESGTVFGGLAHGHVLILVIG